MKSRTPISVVHIASGDLWAGAEVQLFTLVKTLHNFKDVSVWVILLNHGELENRLRALGITVVVLNESRLNGFQILWRIKKLLKAWKTNVVHTHRIKENILGGIASRLAGNIPSLRTVHGAPEHRPGWHKPHKRIIYILDWLVGCLLQQKIIAVSEELAGLLRTEFPSKKIEIIENGVDIEALAPYAKYLENLEKPSTPIKIGLVGRLVPVKRVDIFIKTAKYIKDYHPKITAHFIIYGDGPLRLELENLSTSLGVQEIVHFGGFCNNIHQRIKELDLLLITSDHEGLPMILLEAMALNVPIVAHAVGGIPKVLCSGICGLLVTDHRPIGYAAAIHSLKMEHKRLQNITKNAFKQVYNNYSAYKNASAFREVYYKVINKLS